MVDGAWSSESKRPEFDPLLCHFIHSIKTYYAKHCGRCQEYGDEEKRHHCQRVWSSGDYKQQNVRKPKALRELTGGYLPALGGGRCCQERFQRRRNIYM